MATTIEQQVALDEALACLVTADVPEIYMQEFWATAYVHQYSIRFKMDSKKKIVDMEKFRDMLHICPRVPGQSFDELPFEEEILDFLRFLGHSAQIRTLTDVNINKLFQPWRSFAAVINKCLTGKSFGFDSFRLTAAAKGKQPAKAKSPTDPSEESDEEETREEEEESFDPIPRTPEDREDDGNGEEDQGLRERVKSQVKEQVSQILPRIEKSVNAQLEAKVLTRSFHSSRTSYAVAADLSEMELKKILIEKMIDR
nr:hypothetical protein [Tanacetum cinerariifolium]